MFCDKTESIDGTSSVLDGVELGLSKMHMLQRMVALRELVDVLECG